MNFFEAMQELEKGKKVKKTNWNDDKYLYEYNKKICFSDPFIYKYLNNSDLNQGSWELCKESILDKTEKAYILNIIKPFKNRVCYIIKCDVLLFSYKEEYIKICVNSRNKQDHYINLPPFVRGSMYNNMRSWYKYSLKELGLDE